MEGKISMSTDTPQTSATEVIPQSFLFSIEFRGKHYVGKTTNQKTAGGEVIVLMDVIEFSLYADKKGAHSYSGCYLGDLLPLKTSEYLLHRINEKSPLYMGYFSTLADMQKQKNTLEQIPA
jgi:hypothetical protein